MDKVLIFPVQVTNIPNENKRASRRDEQKQSPYTHILVENVNSAVQSMLTSAPKTHIEGSAHTFASLIVSHSVF